MSKPTQPHDEQATRRAFVRRAMQLAFLLAIFAASLFLTSGRLDWMAAWAYLSQTYRTRSHPRRAMRSCFTPRASSTGTGPQTTVSCTLVHTWDQVGQ